MNTTEEILSYAKTHRSNLLKCCFGVPSSLIWGLRKLDAHKRNALFLLSIESPLELSRFLKTSFLKLEKQINFPDYTQYSISKKRGGERMISAPAPELKVLQKHLNYFLQAYYLWIKPSEVHGFVINPHYLGKQCNIVENAKNHTNKSFVLNIDLKEFFPSISARRVKDLFLSSSFKFNEQIATALTLLTTFEGQLPIGGPTSPAISNFICLELDADLISFCKQHDLTFSRYADDLTFSSNETISNNHILDIINLIKKNNFEINEKKLRLKSANRRQTVTGLTVNEKVNVDRKLLKKIRAMLHDLSKSGTYLATLRHFKYRSIVETEDVPKFINRLEGYINFVGQVRGKNDQLYRRFKAKFDLVFKKEHSGKIHFD